MICAIVVVAGFAGENFESVELIKSMEDGPSFIRTTWWGLKTELLEIGSGEWKPLKK